MKQLYTYCLLLAGFLILAGCGSASRNIFSKKTAHEAYAEDLEDKGLHKTPEGRQWLAAAESALAQLQSVSLPYQHRGYFADDKARALGLKFNLTQGQELRVSINKKDMPSLVLYADLFEAGRDEPMQPSDTARTSFAIPIAATGEYILRLQPQLFRGGAYSLSITTGPSLSFPVPGKSAKAGSFWGADRDGGRRKHEGVDIFAPKGTAVVAAADGVVTGVREGGIGGKTVWMRPRGANLSLYYAHLDEQLVVEGQEVKKGDVLGKVGNTGNARTTPPHLHFGIYTYGGAVDPYPYINPIVREGSAPPQKNLSRKVVLKNSLKEGAVVLAPAKSEATPLAVNAKGYIAELPDGKQVVLPFSIVRS